MSKIRVNAISNRLDEGPPELTRGSTVPSGQTVSVQGNLNVSGISTTGSIVATSVNVVGVLTATLSGDGSNIQNLPVVTKAKVIAFKRLLAYDEFRA